MDPPAGETGDACACPPEGPAHPPSNIDQTAFAIQAVSRPITIADLNSQLLVSGSRSASALDGSMLSKLETGSPSADLPRDQRLNETRSSRAASLADAASAPERRTGGVTEAQPAITPSTSDRGEGIEDSGESSSAPRSGQSGSKLANQQPALAGLALPNIQPAGNNAGTSGIAQGLTPSVRPNEHAAPGRQQPGHSGMGQSGRSPGDPLSLLKTQPNRHTASGSSADPAFAGQLARGFSAAMRSPSGAITIRLSPESLGQLKISIRLPEKGTASPVSAVFEAESPKARKLIENSLPQLREALTQRGLDVGRLDAQLSSASIGRQDTSLGQAADRLGTPNAEGPEEEPSYTAPSADDEAGDHQPPQGQDQAGSFCGTDAGVAQDRLGAAGDQPLEELMRSIGSVGGWEEGRTGLSAGVYRVASTDGGAARVVVDAVA
ncbi:MAG: flagellar hook-length control protein FliK [Phycisphaerales bacterium]